MSENKTNYGSLGSKDSYAVYTDQFDSSLLNPMERSIARSSWGITGLEFVGYDVWHAHEATFLTDNGLPVAGTLKFVYPESSEFIVESKSVKLYLNSFDMCKMGDTIENAISNYTAQIKKDLEEVVEAPVDVGFFRSRDFAQNQYTLGNILDEFIDIETYYNDAMLESFHFDDYNTNYNHVKLALSDGLINSGAFYTTALRSRCRHTKQKDTGTAAVYHRVREGEPTISPISFLKQVVSLREVNEFHEFCCEHLFTRIRKYIKPSDDLMVILLYARRGGIDINPVRADWESMIPRQFIDAKTLTVKAQSQ